MVAKFRRPDFSSKDIELRYENGVVCIYGTALGLKKIADHCHALIKSLGVGHIHIEDSNDCTKESLPGAIAIFDKE